MSEPTKYAEFVVPELNKTRLDAQWSRLAEQRPFARAGRRQYVIPVLGMLALACAVGVLSWPRASRSMSAVWAGAVVASDDAPVEMTLAEGTRIEVEPRSEVKLLESSERAVKVGIGHGSARFDVAKKRTRRFTVDLGQVSVVVTGTQFRVMRRAGPKGDRVQVIVEEGSVEVHRSNGGIVRLRAGEDWSAVVAPESQSPREAHPQPVAEPADVTAEGSYGDLDDALAESSDLVDDESDVGAESDDELSADGSERPANRRSVTRERRRRQARAAAADAGELFDHANLARRSGRLEDAAEMYDDLVARYPRDRRASLAAFELGRLRMDSLRDTRGAVRALERALKLDGRGEFAEDALARLVLAEEARGEHESCRRAQKRYLARYPEGVHAQHVAERCGDR